jgi:GNAT superfamily N-acetyltransferase
LEPKGTGPLRWWQRLRRYYRSSGLPSPCTQPGCTDLAFPGLELCPLHLHEAREALGERACAEATCLAPRFKASRWCRQHFEADAFDQGARYPDKSGVRRRAVDAVHHRPVPGLEFSYESFVDPAGSVRSDANRWPLAFEFNDRRRRIYMFAFLDGWQVGHISAFLHTNNTALIRMISVDQQFQRRGIASALYEALRAEHPGVLIEHGHQNEYARAWWAGYCASRGLDPSDPRS